MRDHFGKPLRLGDDVIYACVSGAGVWMRKMTILGFTPQMVRVAHADNQGEGGHSIVKSTSLILYTQDLFDRE